MTLTRLFSYLAQMLSKYAPTRRKTAQRRNVAYLPRTYPVISHMLYVYSRLSVLSVFPRNVRIYRISGRSVWSARASEKSGAIYFGMTGAFGLLV